VRIEPDTTIMKLKSHQHRCNTLFELARIQWRRNV
jgi:hypothetical protein